MDDITNELCEDKNCNCRNVEPNFRCWYHQESSDYELGRIESLSKMMKAAQDLIEEINEEIKSCTGS